MYKDRQDAGETLARALSDLSLPDPVVFALPRGGLPVAVPVARALDAPLDLILVRKIGVPTQPEVAAGAIVDGPPEHVYYNERVLNVANLTEADLQSTVERKRGELADRRQTYLQGRDPLPVRDRTAIVVDDGIATGATVRAALMALRDRGPAQVVLAVPVAPPDTLEALRPLVDRVVCPETPSFFRAVGLHYQTFDQVSDEEVTRIMHDAMKTGNGNQGQEQGE